MDLRLRYNYLDRPTVFESELYCCSRKIYVILRPYKIVETVMTVFRLTFHSPEEMGWYSLPRLIDSFGIRKTIKINCFCKASFYVRFIREPHNNGVRILINSDRAFIDMTKDGYIVEYRPLQVKMTVEKGICPYVPNIPQRSNKKSPDKKPLNWYILGSAKVADRQTEGETSPGVGGRGSGPLPPAALQSSVELSSAAPQHLVSVLGSTRREGCGAVHLPGDVGLRVPIFGASERRGQRRAQSVVSRPPPRKNCLVMKRLLDMLEEREVFLRTGDIPINPHIGELTGPQLMIPRNFGNNILIGIDNKDHEALSVKLNEMLEDMSRVQSANWDFNFLEEKATNGNWIWTKISNT